MRKDIERVLYTEAQIKARVKELAAMIMEENKGDELITVGVLRGAVMFYADLVREIDMPLHMNFMALSSYGASSRSSGAVRIQYDLEEDIAGKNVLIVEDIVDLGLTLQYLTKTLRSRNPQKSKRAAFSTNRREDKLTIMRIASALRCRMFLSWVTALITLKNTGTLSISVS